MIMICAYMMELTIVGILDDVDTHDDVNDAYMALIPILVMCIHFKR